MKLLVIAWLLVTFAPHVYGADRYELISPDGNIKVSVVKDGSGLHYSVYHNNRPLLLPSRIDMLLAGLTPAAEKWKIKKVSRRTENSKDSITIGSETANFRFEGHPLVYYPQVVKREGVDIYHTSFEEPYQVKPIDSLGRDVLCFSPILVSTQAGPKMVITESDLEDYPGMFISGTDSNRLEGRFAPFPLEEKITEGEFPAAI